MKLLVLGDNHNDIENVLLFLDKIRGNEFDVVVYSGDFTDVNTPKGFTQEDIAKLLIEELKTLNKPLVAIPGNNDAKSIIPLLEKEGISIHGKGKVIKDVGFYGYGGAKTPFNTTIEPSEDEVKAGLNVGWSAVDKAKFKVQVTHNPPLNTRLDMITAGLHVGSKVVRDFIETKKPVVAISAHIHEARGIDRLGSVFLMNSGRFSEGYCGLVEIKDSGTDGNILNLSEI